VNASPKVGSAWRVPIISAFSTRITLRVRSGTVATRPRPGDPRLDPGAVSGRLVLAGEHQRRGDLQARRVQAQGWFLEHRSHDPRHGPPILRFRQSGQRATAPSTCAHRFRGKATVDVRCPAQATAWQEDRTHHRAGGLRQPASERRNLRVHSVWNGDCFKPR
jgi:hypothetical protein